MESTTKGMHLSVVLLHLNIQVDRECSTYAGVLLPLSKELRTGMDSWQGTTVDYTNKRIYYLTGFWLR